MTQGDSILQWVLDNSDDDAPRLVYADWLDEHGDPDRAEFIRVQIELARLNPGQDEDSRLAYVEGGTRSSHNRIDCVLAQVAAERATLAHGPYPELKRREEELLTDHGERWAEPVRPFVVSERFIPSYLFRRGFIERLDIEISTFVEHGAALFQEAPILALKLHGAWEGGEPIAAALALPALSRLTALGIGGLDVPGPMLAALAEARHLCRLSWLALEVELGDAGAELLGNLPHLASLTDLHLESNNIEPPGIAALASSQHLQRLTSLYLAWNPVGNEGVAHLLASPLLDRLTTLDLFWAFIGDAPEVESLLASPRLAGLTTLYLGHNHRLVTDEVEVLARSPHLRRLTTLDLADIPLDLDAAHQLAASPGLAHLTTLNLITNFQDTDGTEAAELLARSPTLGHLAALNLCNNGIGPAGASALASSPHMANLAWLDLSYNDIGTAGALALAQSTTLPALVELNLQGNDIGPEGVDALCQRFGDGLRVSPPRNASPP